MLAPLAVLGGLQKIRTELPPDWQAKLKLVDILPDLSLQTWLIIILFVAILIILESSYRIINKNQTQARQMPNINSSLPVNKLILVAKAIMNAQQVTPVGKDVIVYITDANGLSQILPQEIKSTLVKLQDDEKVILLKLFPEWWWPPSSKAVYHSIQPKVAVKYLTDEELDVEGAAKRGFNLQPEWKLRLKKRDTGALDVFYLSPRGLIYHVSKYNPDGSWADYEVFNADGKPVDFSQTKVEPSEKHFIVNTLDVFDKWYKENASGV